MDLIRRLFFYISYFRKPPWDTGTTPPELLAFIEDQPPGRALDLGCGTGTNAITLAQHGWQVVGVDFIGRAIQEARRKARREGVTIEFYVDDVTRLKDVNGHFDLVLDIGCFHILSPEDKTRYSDNLTRLLAPEGTFLMYAFFKEAGSSGGGMEEVELDILDQCLQLVKREDGTERGRRPAAWFTYQKEHPTNEQTKKENLTP